MSQRGKRTLSLVIPDSQPSYSVKRGRTTRPGSKIRKSFKLVSGRDNKRVRMPYADFDNVAVQDGSYQYLTFRGNSVYDPDYAVGGHQALGFDQYDALFRQYFVRSSSIKVAVSASSVTGGQYTYVYVWADSESNSPTTAANTAEVCAARGGKMTRIGSNYTIPSTIYHKASTKAILDHGMEDPQLCGEGADPVVAWYWHIVVQSHNAASATTYPTDINVELMYDTEWFDAKTLGQS